jgi:hypothetical protein
MTADIRVVAINASIRSAVDTFAPKPTQASLEFSSAAQGISRDARRRRTAIATRGLYGEQLPGARGRASNDQNIR